MKKIFTLLFVFISAISFAQNTHLNPVNQGGATSQGATYYVSSTGLSTGPGSTPETAITFDRLISFSANFVGGEKIYLMSGDTVRGDLSTIQSGTYIGKYKAGIEPVINGCVRASTLTWTQAGNIWYATMATRINRVFRNGVPERCAQSVYYPITAKANSTTATATTAIGLGSWAATTEMIFKEFDFRWRYAVSATYNSGTGQFTFAPGNSSAVTYQFKLLNDTNLIAADGDYAWKAGKIFYRSPGNVNPNTLNVELSIYDEGLRIKNNASNVIIENINFFGQNFDGIYGDSVNLVTIRNCVFKHQFNAAIALSSSTYGSRIESCRMDSIYDNAIMQGVTKFSTISNTRITNIGMGTEPPLCRDTFRYRSANPGFQSVSMEPGNGGFGILILPNSNNNTIEYDTLYNLAYNGIEFMGSNNIVRYNRVDSFSKRQNDAAGIGTYSNPYAYKTLYGWDTCKNNVISNNYISNGIGTNEGGPAEANLAIGIYLDNGTFNTKVIGNTVKFCGIGIDVNWGDKRNSIISNHIYGNDQQLRIVNNTTGAGGSGDTATSHIVEDNTFVALNTTQQCIQIFDYNNISFNPFLNGGSAQRNYFISPYTNNIIQRTVSASTTTNYTLATAITQYGVTFGQQDNFSEAFVNIDTSKAHIVLQTNPTFSSASLNLPTSFRRPIGRIFEPLLGPYMSTVAINTPNVYFPGSMTVGSTVQGSSTLSVNSATPAVGFFISDVFKGYIGISGSTNNGITGSILGDMTSRVQGINTNNLLWSVDQGSSYALRINSNGNVTIGNRVPVSALDIYRTSGDAVLTLNTTSTTNNAGVTATNSAAKSMQFGITGPSITVTNKLLQNMTYVQSNLGTGMLFRNITLTGYTPVYFSYALNNVDSVVGGFDVKKEFFIGPNINNYTAKFDSATTGVTGMHVINNGHTLLNTAVDNGQLTVAGVIAPEASGTRDLGTSSFKFRNYYGQIVGTTTNDNASAGNSGEYVSSLIASGSAVSLTTATATNITSISLTAGDWDVSGRINYTETVATVSARSGGIGSTTATLPTDGSEGYCGVQSTITSEVNSITLDRKRISISGTTTIYLVGSATFSAGTCAGFGQLTARRVR